MYVYSLLTTLDLFTYSYVARKKPSTFRPHRIHNARMWHITTRISIQTAGLAFGGTGLCTYRVRGVDGSCAEHFTVESYTVFICQQSYLLLFWYSITHSLFHSRVKTFLFCKSFPLQPFLFLLHDSLHGLPRLFTVISEHICFLLLVFLFLHFLVVGSVR